MNQIARGGDDPTPPEGGTTRVPQTSQSQGLAKYWQGNFLRCREKKNIYCALPPYHCCGPAFTSKPSPGDPGRTRLAGFFLIT